MNYIVARIRFKKMFKSNSKNTFPFPEFNSRRCLEALVSLVGHGIRDDFLHMAFGSETLKQNC